LSKQTNGLLRGFSFVHSKAAAFCLAQKFEMPYPPKKGSWLNMEELELSALSRICMSRRIVSIEELDREIQALVKERNELEIKVEWQFSIAQAREKLSRLYEKVKLKTSITEHWFDQKCSRPLLSAF
jgi:hypothetical protein